MDCVDCHNRPTHAFELPHRGLDREITAGSISRDLPFVKKQALELLKAKYASQDEATKAIADGLAGYYAATYPTSRRRRRAEIEAAVKAVQAVYLRNVFPNMKLDWGYHPNNIGHEDFPGCFRCHGGNHESKDGTSDLRRLRGVPPGARDGRGEPGDPDAARPEVARERRDATQEPSRMKRLLMQSHQEAWSHAP